VDDDDDVVDDDDDDGDQSHSYKLNVYRCHAHTHFTCFLSA